MNPNVFARFSEETNHTDITSYKFEQSIQPSVRVNILASSGSNTFATVARIILEQTLSKNMVAKDEPVFFAIAHSTGRLCETKHINDKIVACLIVKSIVAIKAIGAYIGRQQLVKNTTADSAGNPNNGNNELIAVPITSITP